MAAPVAADFKWYDGANGIPTDDTSAIIGAIDTGAAMTPGESGQLIATGEADVAGGSARTHYGGGYIKLEEGASGSLLNGNLWLANGGVVTPGANTIVVTDPTGENEDLELVLMGIASGSGAVTEDALTITSGSAESSFTLAAGSRWWLATKDNVAIAGVNGTDDLVVTCGGTQIALMRAPLSGHYANGCRVVGSIFEMAVASAYGETLSAANRLAAPTATSGLSTFNSGAYLTGTDHRHALSTFADNTYKGFALKKVIPAGMGMPSQGMPHLFMLTGLASA